MEAYGLYYSYTQYWTHSSKGYLVHGPCFPRYTCLDIQKCTKFKRLLHYLIRCVHRADVHFMEAYGLYYSYTHYWTHSSKDYFVHGPCFPRYTCLDIRKCTKFKRLSHYLIRCVHRADFHFMEAYGLYYSYLPIIGPIAQRATWYMDHAFHDTLVELYENALSSSDYHTT